MKNDRLIVEIRNRDAKWKMCSHIFLIIIILILTWSSGSKAEGQSLTSTLCWKRILITMEGALYTMMWLWRGWWSWWLQQWYWRQRWHWRWHPWWTSWGNWRRQAEASLSVPLKSFLKKVPLRSFLKSTSFSESLRRQNLLGTTGAVYNGKSQSNFSINQICFKDFFKKCVLYGFSRTSPGTCGTVWKQTRRAEVASVKNTSLTERKPGGPVQNFWTPNTTVENTSLTERMKYKADGSVQILLWKQKLDWVKTWWTFPNMHCCEKTDYLWVWLWQYKCLEIYIQILL